MSDEINRATLASTIKIKLAILNDTELMDSFGDAQISVTEIPEGVFPASIEIFSPTTGLFIVTLGAQLPPGEFEAELSRYQWEFWNCTSGAITYSQLDYITTAEEVLNFIQTAKAESL